jgi:hypothetical protein
MGDITMIQAKVGVLASSISTWTTSTSYEAGNIAIRVNTLYLCGSNHTSGTFYVDWLTNQYWMPISDAPGHIKLSGRATTISGYLLCDGQTVGDSTSGADFAGDTYRELYEYIQDGFGGTYNWSNHDTVNLPDFRGVFPKGAGTTDRTLGKDANGNFYAATFGSYVQDKFQGHRMPPFGTDTDFLCAPSAGGTAQLTGGPGWLRRSTTGDPVTDGTNGTPRTGLTTEPQHLGVTFLIKY